MRLFTAINFNDEVLDKLMDIQVELKRRSLKGKFTRKENLHLTLVFLGEIEPSKVELVKKAMDSVSEDAFSISFRGLGYFKRSGYGRTKGDIWWVGIEKNRMLNKIYQRLSVILKGYGFKVEEREYKPHLTLAREVILQEGVDKNQFPDFPSLQTKVSKISLMKSERIGGVLTYTEIYHTCLNDME